MNVNSFQDHENVTPCQALHKPIMGQALAKHWPSIGQALVKHWPRLAKQLRQSKQVKHT